MPSGHQKSSGSRKPASKSRSHAPATRSHSAVRAGSSSKTTKAASNTRSSGHHHHHHHHHGHHRRSSAIAFPAFDLPAYGQPLMSEHPDPFVGDFGGPGPVIDPFTGLPLAGPEMEMSFDPSHMPVIGGGIPQQRTQRLSIGGEVHHHQPQQQQQQHRPVQQQQQQQQQRPVQQHQHQQQRQVQQQTSAPRRESTQPRIARQASASRRPGQSRSVAEYRAQTEGGYVVQEPETRYRNTSSLQASTVFAQNNSNNNSQYLDNTYDSSMYAPLQESIMTQPPQQQQQQQQLALITHDLAHLSVAAVGEWIASVNGGRFAAYAGNFMAESIDGPTLVQLTDADLEDVLGMRAPLHRRRLLQEIASYSR